MQFLGSNIWGMEPQMFICKCCSLSDMQQNLVHFHLGPPSVDGKKK